MLQALQQVIANAIQRGKESGKGDVTSGRNPVRDADAEVGIAKGRHVLMVCLELVGCHYFMNVNSNRKPELLVLDPSMNGQAMTLSR